MSEVDGQGVGGLRVRVRAERFKEKTRGCEEEYEKVIWWNYSHEVMEVKLEGVESYLRRLVFDGIQSLTF